MAINVIIDISKNESPVDFAAAAASGIVGVFHKATEGVGYADPRYLERVPLAREAGLLWGAYHFGTGRRRGADQADYFLSTVGNSEQTLLVLDFEENPSGPKHEPRPGARLRQPSARTDRALAGALRWPLPA